MSETSAPHRPLRDVIADTALRGIGLVPHGVALGFGSLLGRVAGLALLRKRETLEQNLVAAGVSDPRRGCTRAALHAGRNVAEIAWLLSQSQERVDACVDVVGLDVVREAIAEKRGMLLVAGHIGNWELVARAAASGVPGTHTAVIARDLGTPRVERRIAEFRSAGGVSTLVRGAPGSSVAALRTLKRGGILGCMMDRSSNGRRIAVPFLGRAMKVPLGPLVLAERARCPIVFGVAKRDPSGRTHVSFDRIDETGAKGAEDLARCVGKRLETAIRDAPEQWYWINRRTAVKATKRKPRHPAESSATA